MVGLEAIGEAVGALKGVADIAKTSMGLKDAGEIKAKAAELLTQVISAQTGALTAQADQLGLLQRVSTLESQLRQKEDWELEKSSYKLEEIRSGVFAYVPKAGATTETPKHYLCPTCFSRQKLTILQKQLRSPRSEVLVCNACPTELYAVGQPTPAAVIAGAKNRR